MAVTQVGPDSIQLSDGQSLPATTVFWVTGAAAAPWLRESGLATTEQGFVQVNDSLQSVSHPQVFATGDIAHVVNHPRPKSGVFAVRQGPPLTANLRRVLNGRHRRQTPATTVSESDQYR
ncbi:MAG: FAD-dependent oxidoreductase [Gammaproteobacteria bacterium]